MSVRRKPLRRSSRGDTIVEVMIVLAVLGFAISISYATANRSLLDARRAQESSEAGSLLQTQVEGLRSMAAIPTPSADQNIFRPTATKFCVNTAVSPYLLVDITEPAPPPATDPCYKRSLYYVSITYINDAASNPDTFTLKATWPDVAGEGDDSVTLIYRVHKPTP